MINIIPKYIIKYSKILLMQLRNFLKIIVKSQIDFQILQKAYKIRILSLKKLTLHKVVQLYGQIQFKYKLECKKRKTWVQNQLRVFIWMIFHYSHYLHKTPQQLTQQEWKTISQYFHKDFLTTKYFFFCLQKNRKTDWTKSQDQFIESAISNLQFANQWTQIGRNLFVSSEGNYFKKPKEIRERWNNYLNPNVLKDKWSAQEDLIMFEMVLKYGNKWALISKLMKTRSQHSVKNRYFKLLKAFKEEFQGQQKLKRSQLQRQFIRNYLLKLQNQHKNIGQQRYQEIQNQENKQDYKIRWINLIQQDKQLKNRGQISKQRSDLESLQQDEFINEEIIINFQPTYQSFSF